MIQAPGPASLDSDGLLAGAQAGNAEALGTLAERYRPYLREVAARVLGVKLPGECSSVVEDGIVVALAGFARFRGQSGAEFLGWLAKIVKNKALMQLRRARRFQPLPAGSSDDLPIPASSSGPSAQAARREQTANLLALVERLPPDYRAVIGLRYLEDVPYPEIAQRLGRTEAAVRKLVSRALAMLRETAGDEP